MSFDPRSIAGAVVSHGTVVRIVVTAVSGSAPRDAGASMIVWRGGQSGTIGGGVLEHQAVAAARGLLGNGGSTVRRVPLGPDLGQCCGGSVSLVSEVIDAPRLDEIVNSARYGCVFRPVAAGSRPPLALQRHLSAVRSGASAGATCLIEGWLAEPLQTLPNHLWVFGAGHVGRAIVGVIAELPDWQITWIDTDANRFPGTLPAGVDRLIAANPADAVRHSPPDCHHLVVTYSHALDLELCHALLGHGFASLGLIGSSTKWARFRKRLGQLGDSDASIARIRCPMGDPSLGKHPQAIAIGVSALLLRTTAATTETAMDRPA